MRVSLCLSALGCLAVSLFTSPVATAQGYTFDLTWGGIPNGGDGQIANPSGVAVDGSGNVYVVQRKAKSKTSSAISIGIQKFDSSGTLITKWGSVGSGDGEFAAPEGVAVDGSGNVYVSDPSIDRIQKFNSSGTFITKWGSSGGGDGQFSVPGGLAVDGSGNVYVGDAPIPNGAKVIATKSPRIQKFDSSGTFITKWGSFGSGDGQFSSSPSIHGVAADVTGNIYVSDSNNDRIQKFDSSGTFLTQWGSAGTLDGQFTNALGVAVDGSGNVYVVDGFVGAVKLGSVLPGRIQKFDSSGTYLTQWGGGGTDDG